MSRGFRGLVPVLLARRVGSGDVLADFTGGTLPAPFTISRASGGMTRSAAGVYSWVGANVARFDGTAGLLIEGQRTNTVRNPRAEGGTPGVVGSGGVMPTNWSTGFQVTGMTLTCNAGGVENGLPYAEFRLTGTPASSGPLDFNFETTSGVAAVSGDVWCNSFFYRLVSGSLNGLGGAQAGITEFDAASGYLAFSVGNIANPGATMQSGQHVRTLANAACAFALPFFRLTVLQAAAVDLTFRLYAPQFEKAAFPSSPILPTAGSPAQSTRAGDVVTASLAALGVSFAGTGITVIERGVLPFQPATSSRANFVAVEASGAGDAYQINTVFGTPGSIEPVRIVGNGYAGPGALGTYTAGTPVNVGMAISNAGRLAASLNGGAVQSITGGGLAMTTLRLGARGQTGGENWMFGRIAKVSVSPKTLSDAELIAAVGAFS